MCVRVKRYYYYTHLISNYDECQIKKYLNIFWYFLENRFFAIKEIATYLTISQKLKIQLSYFHNDILIVSYWSLFFNSPVSYLKGFLLIKNKKKHSWWYLQYMYSYFWQIWAFTSDILHNRKAVLQNIRHSFSVIFNYFQATNFLNGS